MNKLSTGKNGHIWLKIVLLKINLQNEGHLYTNVLLYILTIYFKCLLSRFSLAIRVHILMVTKVQTERISGYKNGHILL